MTGWRRHGWLLWPIGLLALGVGVETSGIFSELRFAVHRRPADMPSTRAVPLREVAAGYPVLSIAADRDDLLHPERGLLTHPMERGRDWERFAYASFLNRGQLVFASGAGLRVHGGRSRLGSEKKSFSLRFRRRYGDPGVPAEIFFGRPASDLERLVVHNDLRQDRTGRRWQFVNPLAYDIAAKIGAITARTLPVRFILNGESQGVYVLTEPIDPAFFEARFGHRDFHFEHSETSILLRHWSVNTEPFTMAAASTRVDLENLTRWVISILFCGTTDIWQGTLARDLRSPREEWFWIAWDMDHSFMDLYQRASVPWEIDTFSSLLGKPDARSRILGRLLEQDPKYREYFVQTVTDALNHRITPEFLSERLNHYRILAGRYELAEQEFLDITERFLAERPARVRELVQQYIGAGEIREVRVRTSAGVPLEIDGYRTEGDYSGRYFEGSSVSVAIPTDARSRFQGWTVNETRLPDANPVLVLRVDGPLEIAPAFSER